MASYISKQERTPQQKYPHLDEKYRELKAVFDSKVDSAWDSVDRVLANATEILHQYNLLLDEVEALLKIPVDDNTTYDLSLLKNALRVRIALTQPLIACEAKEETKTASVETKSTSPTSTKISATPKLKILTALPTEILRNVLANLGPRSSLHLLPALSDRLLDGLNDVSSAPKHTSLLDTAETKSVLAPTFNSKLHAAADPARLRKLNTDFSAVLQSKLAGTALAFTGTLQEPLLTTPNKLATQIQVLFQNILSEILLGNLSEEEAISQINQVLAYPQIESPVSSTLLIIAKHFAANLNPLSQAALGLGFTLADISAPWFNKIHVQALRAGFKPAYVRAHWFSHNHIKAVDRLVTEILTRDELMAQLQGLRGFQVRGLMTGFTLAEVQQPWCTPFVIEVLCGGYGWDVAGIRSCLTNLQQASVAPDAPSLCERLKDTILQEIILVLRQGDAFTNPETWQDGITALIPEFIQVERDDEQLALIPNPNNARGQSPLYIVANEGQAEILTAMREAAGLTPEAWPIALTELLPSFAGKHAGRSCLFIAGHRNYPEVLRAMRRGFRTAADWRAFIDIAIPNSYSVFALAAAEDYSELLKALYETGEYTPELWDAIMDRTIVTGRYIANTCRSTALFHGCSAALKTMKELGNYRTTKAWQMKLTTPYAIDAEICFLIKAAAPVDALIVIQDIGMYSGEQWRIISNTVQGKEMHELEGTTALFTTALLPAARNGEALKALLMHQKDYTPMQRRTDLSRPLTTGPYIGTSPLSIAILAGFSDVIRAMYIAGEYTPELWRIHLNKPFTIGPHIGLTPLYLAAGTSPDVLLAIYQAGKYTPTSWRADIQRCLVDGPQKDHTPLGMALFSKDSKTLPTMQKLGQYSKIAWEVEINKLFDARPEIGENFLFMLANEPENTTTLSAILETFAYTQEECQSFITTVVTTGPNKGKTPITAASHHGKSDLLKTMQQACGHTDHQWAIVWAKAQAAFLANEKEEKKYTEDKKVTSATKSPIAPVSDTIDASFLSPPKIPNGLIHSTTLTPQIEPVIAAPSSTPAFATLSNLGVN